MYKVNPEKCANCGFCAFVCPFDSLVHHVDEKYWEIDQEKCKQCGQCYEACVAVAIEADDDQQRVDTIEINKEVCIGCSLCSRACPVGAISGVIKQPFEINPSKCIKCGFCATKCRKQAIDVTYKLAKREIKNHKDHSMI